MGKQLQRIGVSIEEDLLVKFDTYIQDKGYTNRSEAIRDLIRKDLVEEMWDSNKVYVMATITLVYNHHQRELSEKLKTLQHHHLDHVISTMHVHQDEINCLEVIVCKGDKEHLLNITNSIRSMKGVKLCEIVCAVNAENIISDRE